MKKYVPLLFALALVLAFAPAAQAAELTVQVITTTGIDPTATAAAALGDTFDNDGETFFHIINGAGAPITVTFAAVAACSLGELHDIDVIVTNAEERMIGPFPTHIYNDIAGEVAVTYTSEATITVGAFRL